MLEVTNLSVQTFGSACTPDGINADLVLNGGITLLVYRGWDDPQWYVYDVVFQSDIGPRNVGIEDIDNAYPIPRLCDASRLLDRKVDSIRSDYTPA